MRFSVLGAGSWGTVFAKLLAENGHEVLLWARREELAESVNKNHENTEYLPDVKLPQNLIATSRISEVEDFSENLIIAVPVKYIEEVLETFSKKPKIVVNLSKGIDGKLRTVSSIVRSRWKDIEYSVLSGPSHAPEVAIGLPTSVVVASENQELARKFQVAFSNEYFRVYTCEDVLGVEISGAVKNVIAIAAGVIDGLGRWHNAKAALITRGLHEISKFGLAFGCKSPLTFMGLAGMGDLIVTCTSTHSRNRYVGEMIAKGMKLVDVLKDMKMVAEGVHTVKPLLEIADLLKVDMPICQQVYEVLFMGKEPSQAIYELMTRPLKMEIEFRQTDSERDLSDISRVDRSGSSR